MGSGPFYIVAGDRARSFSADVRGSRRRRGEGPRPGDIACSADEAGLVGEHHPLGTVAHPEFDHRPGDVGLGRGRAHVEALGDLVIAETLADERHDLLLPVGEEVQGG